MPTVGKRLAERERRRGAGVPRGQGRPFAEASERARRCAVLILEELDARNDGTARRRFTIPSAIRYCTARGFDPADVMHALLQLMWESMIEPARKPVAAQIGFQRTKAPRLDRSADLGELCLLRIAQRRYLAFRGWRRVISPERIQPEKSARGRIRSQLLATDERWGNDQLAGFPMPIDNAVAMQAILDEVAVQPPEAPAKAWAVARLGPPPEAPPTGRKKPA